MNGKDYLVVGTILVLCITAFVKFIVSPIVNDARYGTFSPAIAAAKTRELQTEVGSEAKVVWYFDQSASLYRVEIKGN